MIHLLKNVEENLFLIEDIQKLYNVIRDILRPRMLKEYLKIQTFRLGCLKKLDIPTCTINIKLYIIIIITKNSFGS